MHCPRTNTHARARTHTHTHTQASTRAHTYIHSYIYTYVYVRTYLHTHTHTPTQTPSPTHTQTHAHAHTHTHTSFHWSTNSVIQQSDIKLVRKKTCNTQTKQTTQYNTNKQTSILQFPKSNTVHNIIIKQYNTNYNRNNLSN